MPRIKLASWYGDKAPGEEIDVDGATLKALRRDGRVAEVVDGSYDNGGTLQAGAASTANDTGEPEPVEPAPHAEGRRKR